MWDDVNLHVNLVYVQTLVKAVHYICLKDLGILYTEILVLVKQNQHVLLILSVVESLCHFIFNQILDTQVNFR